jgi:hypothetical protein
MLHHATQLFCLCVNGLTNRASLQEVLQVELKGRCRERQLEVLEHCRVHDTEAANLLRLLVGELEEDSSRVAREVRGIYAEFGQLRY